MIKEVDFRRMVQLAKEIEGVRNYKVIALYRHQNFLALSGNSLKSHPDSKKIDPKTGIEFSNSHAEISLLRQFDDSRAMFGTLYIARFKHLKDGSLVSGLAKPCAHCQGYISRFISLETYYLTNEGTWEKLDPNEIRNQNP